MTHFFLFAANAPRVENHVWDNRQHQHHSNRCKQVINVIAADGPVVPRIFHHRCQQQFVIVIRRKSVGDVKDLKYKDHQGCPNDQNGGINLWQLDAEKHLKWVRTVNGGRLNRVAGNTAQCGGKNHHGKTGLYPNQDPHKEKVAPEFQVIQLFVVFSAMTQQCFEQADLIRWCQAVYGFLGLNTTAGKNVAPNNGSTNERNGQRDENKRLGDDAPFDRICQYSNQQPKTDTDRRHQNQPHQRVTHRQAELQITQSIRIP